MTKQTKKRKIGLSIIIVLLIVANIAGLFQLQSDPEAYAETYRLSVEQTRWLMILPIASFIYLIGIWFGQRWGLLGAVLVFVLTLALDVYNKVWSHALLTVIGFGLLGLFCWRSRAFFEYPSTEFDNQKFKT